MDKQQDPIKFIVGNGVTNAYREFMQFSKALEYAKQLKNKYPNLTTTINKIQQTIWFM